MATLVRDFFRRVSVGINDFDPQFERYAEADLVAATNDGQRAIAKFLPQACARTASILARNESRQSIAAAAGIDGIDPIGGDIDTVDGVALQSVIANMGANGETPGSVIRLVAREVLDASRPAWHTDTGATVRNYVYDPDNPTEFYVWPHPAPGTNLWLRISYLANPKAIAAPGVTSLYGAASNNTTTLSVADTWVDDLWNYVMARLYLRDSEDAANAALAATHTQAFVGSINAQAQMLAGKNPNLKMLPFAGPTPTTAAQ